MTELEVKTDFRIKKEAREFAIYSEWHELMKQPGAMSTAVDNILMNKYNIFSKSTIWFIRKRVEKRLGMEQSNNESNPVMSPQSEGK